MDLVVLAGLQGSGKSTFFRARFAETHAHVSMDDLRNNRNPRRRQRELVAQAAAAGRSVVVDNTSVRHADRAELVALAHALGMRPVLYWFPPDPKASIARNAGREGKARVPVVAILATAKRAEPPAPDEGFAEAFEVRARADGAFDVAALPATRPSAPP